MYTHVLDEDIPEDEPWRTDKQGPAVEYFTELRESLVSLEMVPLPTHMPGGDWKIWRVEDFGDEHRNWVLASFQVGWWSLGAFLLIS